MEIDSIYCDLDCGCLFCFYKLYKYYRIAFRDNSTYILFIGEIE
jgi:hypothetical protein